MNRFLRLLRARVPNAAALAAALVATEMLRTLQVVAAAPGRPYLAAITEQFANWLLTSLLAIAIICACESVLSPGRLRVAAQALCLASASALYAYFIGTSPMLTVQYTALGMDGGAGLFMYTLWLGWAISALLSWYYWALEKSMRASAALGQEQIARQRTHQRLLESRLQVLEAQVEPRFLLESLARVQVLYEQQPAHADRALDDLIDYLRAALPQLRERASTLGREMSLIDAYLRIASHSPPRFETRLPRLDGEVERTYAPPMVLLPIVQLALAAGSKAQDKPSSLAIRIETAPGRVAAHFEFTAAHDWYPAATADTLRATLEQLFGSDGHLAVSNSGGRALVSVSWPSAPATSESSLHPLPTLGGTMDEISNTRRDLLALIAAFGAGGAAAQDAVRMAPRNYRVAFENDKVRVLEYYSKPGVGLCGQGRHFHPAHLTVALTDSKARVKLDDGRVIIAEDKAGNMFWAPAQSHTVENIGKSDVRAYIVETKDADWKPSTWSDNT